MPGRPVAAATRAAKACRDNRPMGTLYLVRHGQASFGADNYDLLSPLGQRQCQRLGEYFAAKGRVFTTVITGTLVRQIQSQQAIVAATATTGATPEPLRLPGLNEYDSHAVISTFHPQPGAGWRGRRVIGSRRSGGGAGRQDRPTTSPR